MKGFFRLLRTIFLICILIAGGIFYAFFIEPNLFITSNIDIVLNENPTKQVKIVLFADTHYREKHTELEMQNMVDRINAEKPDIVMFAGDLIDDYENQPVDTDLIANYFKKIDAKIGKYAIMGNHDYGGRAERIYKEIMQKSDFNLLINDISILEDLELEIVGIDDYFFGTPDFEILDSTNEERTVLVLSHEADMLDEFSDKFDLSFAGHTHGGQINIPYIKELALSEGGEKYIKGYYEEEKIYVTSGIGTTRIHARMFNLPEIVSINLKY